MQPAARERDAADDGDSPDDGSMTLAFDAAALDALADPAAVFDDARTWSRYVGVVSDKMAYQVVNYLRERGVYEEDFFSRASKQRGLAHAKRRTDTDRYVFVSASADAADVAAETGWEHLPVEEAATAAEWELTSADSAD